MAADNYTFSTNIYKKQGYLYCENIKLTSIVTSLNEALDRSSPAFVYSQAQIEHNVNSYLDALKQTGLDFILGYSVKANYNINLLILLRKLGCSAVTVSGFELKLALGAGFPPNKIIYNGNGKTDWEINLAITCGCFVNVDSHFDLARIIKVAKELGKKVKVMIRVNTDIDPNVHPYLATGLAVSKFGVEENQIPDLLKVIQGEPLVQLVGLHCHLGSSIENMTVIEEATDRMLAIYDRLKEQGFSDLKYLDMGGGLGIDYQRHAFRTQDPASPKEDRVGLPDPAALVAGLKTKIGDRNMCLVLEPGRSIIGNAALLLSKVLGHKEMKEKKFIVIDGSMNEVIRPSLYGAYHHIELLAPTEASAPKHKWDVVGPVCECADFVGKDRYLPAPPEDCGLAVFDVGAYCASMCSNYNMRFHPVEVLVSGEKWRLIRKPDSFEEVIAPSVGLKRHYIDPEEGLVYGP